VLRALRAIRILRYSGSWPNVRVVVTGGAPRFAAPTLLEGVTVLPYVSRQCLAALYRFARALIYPTLNEGFGYPPIESLRFGTPVAAAGVCSLPEIYGDSISYFDPRNEIDIATKVWQVLNDPPCAQATRRRASAVMSRQDADLDRLIDLLCTHAT
jgi:glycosyltransferase involved in cell wall biosynthesis